MLERLGLQQVRAGSQMNALQIGILASCATCFIGFLGGNSLQLFGKGGLLDLRRQLAEEKDITSQLRDVIAKTEFPSQGNEGESLLTDADSHPSLYGWVCAKRGHKWGNTTVESSRCIFCGVTFVELYASKEVKP
jgi:hypothetical protein